MAGSIVATLSSTISKAAPLLGLAFGGAPGGLVGSLIGQLFGGSPGDPEELLRKINSDPDAAIKLLTLQNDHLEFLQTHALDTLKTTNADLADARSRQVEMAKAGIHEWIMPVLAVLSMMQFWLYIIFCKFYNLQIDVTILTDLFAMAFMAFTFYFGSSHGERSLWTSSNSRAPYPPDK